MLSAAKEETFSAFGPWCAETSISASECEGEKPHQGVAGKNPALHPGITWSNSTTALGLRGARLETRVRSRCTGKERDTESGLDEFGARYYGSSLGRFMTPDWATKPTDVPYANFGNPQSLNLYSYVQNNPTTMGDPDGHDCPPCVAVIEDIFAFAGEGAKDGAALGPEGALAGAGLGLGIGVVANGGGRSPAGYVPGGSLTDENGNSIFQMSKQGSSSNAQTSGQSAPPASQSTPAQPEPPSGNDLNRSSSTKQTGAQGQNTETTVKEASGSTTYKTTPGKTGGQSTMVVRKDANGNTVYVKQEARTNNKDFTKPPDHVHYKKPIDKEVN